MSQVVKNQQGFLEILADCPDHQHQFFLRTATPQQADALIQAFF